jgi:AraC family transcriptional regulator of adaptative response/methylated-DNA-[protein]-cysteine methyltransferase
MSFHDSPSCNAGAVALRAAWPNATFTEDSDVTAPIFERIFATQGDPRTQALPLLVRGTNFQVKVWQALLELEPGALCSYGQVADRVGRAGAARAVGGAVGRNHVAWLIPCHRVITSMGSYGHYGWGAVRKKAMIGWELAQRERIGR